MQVRTDIRDAFSDIFANKVSVEDGMNAAVERGNVVLRKFEKLYAGKEMP